MLGACGGEGDDRQVQLVAFNVGLTEADVPHTEERAPLVIDALAASDADVSCLSEVWEAAHFNTLASRTAERFPHTVRSAPLPGADAAYLFDGAFDVAILSAFPVEVHDTLVLDSFEVRASVEYALIDAPIGPLHVFCTHLASDVSRGPYGGEHGSYEGENDHQIQQLLAFVEEKTGGAAPAVVLGDLGTGPEVAGTPLVAVWPTHYQRLIDAGFTNPYAAQPDVACTSCPDNSFRRPESDAKLTDHVLVRDVQLPTVVHRLHTEEVAVPVDGAPQGMHLSDHYGLQLTLAP